MIIRLDEEWSTYKKLLFLQAMGGGALSEYEVTGNPVAFNTNVAKPLSGFTIPFLPVQQGTGDPSPENVRPISGWQGLTAWRTGKNLLDSSFCTDRTSKGITSVRNVDGSITLSGTWNGNRYFNPSDTLGLVLNPGTYTLTEHLRLEETGVGYVQETFTLTKKRTFTNAYFYGWNTGETVNATIYPQLECGSTASPYTTYTGASYPVTFPATGKNLCDKSELVQGAIRGTDGTVVSSTTRVTTGFIPVKGDTTYIASFENGLNVKSARFYDADKNPIGSVNLPADNVMTSPENAYYVRFAIGYVSGGDIVVSDVNQPQLEIGSTATAYEPFTNTVYGGTLDAVNGVLTVEWGKFVATSSAIRRNDGNRWYIPNTYTNSIIPQADTANAVISNVFKSATGGQYDDKCFINSSGAIRFNTSEEYESINALLSAIPEMEFVFLLATPIEIPLDHITVQTLIGDNTIWTDTNGENTVKYLKKG